MFTLPDLPFDYNELEPYTDEQTMHLHHEKHHATYIKNLNDALEGHEDLLNMDVEELIKNLDQVPEDIRTKVRNNGGGHANHSFFWTILKPNGSEIPEDLKKAIEEDFGDLEQFKEKFKQAGLSRFGSGWAWLIVVDGKLEITDTANQDSPLMEGKSVIMGVDVWEHAYYLKYQNKRADYLDAFWNILNWEEVAKRYQQALG